MESPIYASMYRLNFEGGGGNEGKIFCHFVKGGGGGGGGSEVRID